MPWLLFAPTCLLRDHPAKPLSAAAAWTLPYHFHPLKNNNHPAGFKKRGVKSKTEKKQFLQKKSRRKVTKTPDPRKRRGVEEKCFGWLGHQIAKHRKNVFFRDSAARRCAGWERFEEFSAFQKARTLLHFLLCNFSDAFPFFFDFFRLVPTEAARVKPAPPRCGPANQNTSLRRLVVSSHRVFALPRGGSSPLLGRSFVVFRVF